jgi:hypothetical protein
VFEAIRDKAKTGNPQAVREYREWLMRLRLVGSDAGENALHKPLEDMTPDGLAFADLYAERRIARAARRLEGMRKAAEKAGTLPDADPAFDPAATSALKSAQTSAVGR